MSDASDNDDESQSIGSIASLSESDDVETCTEALAQDESNERIEAMNESLESDDDDIRSSGAVASQAEQQYDPETDPCMLHGLLDCVPCIKARIQALREATAAAKEKTKALEEATAATVEKTKALEEENHRMKHQEQAKFLSTIRKSISDGDLISLSVDESFIKNMSNLDDESMDELLKDLGRITVKEIKGEFAGELKTLSSERLKRLYATVGADKNLMSATLEFDFRYTKLCRAAVKSMVHATQLRLIFRDREVEVDPASGQLVERRAIQGEKPIQHLAAFQKELEKLALFVKHHTRLQSLRLERSNGLFPIILPALHGHPTLKTVSLLGGEMELSQNSNTALANFLAVESEIDVVLLKFEPQDLTSVIPTAQVNSINCKTVSHSILRALFNSNVKSIELRSFLLSHYEVPFITEAIPVKENLHELCVWTFTHEVRRLRGYPRAWQGRREEMYQQRKLELARIDASVLAVMEAAALRKDLKVVKWHVEVFTIEVAQALTKCMLNNKGLKEIWLSASSADTAAQSEFLKELEKSYTLQAVHLTDRSTGGTCWDNRVKWAAKNIPRLNRAGRALSMTTNQACRVLGRVAQDMSSVFILLKSTPILFDHAGPRPATLKEQIADLKDQLDVSKSRIITLEEQNAYLQRQLEATQAMLRDPSFSNHRKATLETPGVESTARNWPSTL